MKCSGENVRKKEKIVLPFIARCPRQLQTIKISVRDQNELRLTTFIRPHSSVSVGCMWVFGIHHEAGFSVAAMAVGAVSAAILKGNTTRSPFVMLWTASPTSSITPMISWPTTVPFFRGVRPSYMCKSLPQIPVVVTLRMASKGESIFGFD
jgi:hypothetical protein